MGRGTQSRNAWSARRAGSGQLQGLYQPAYQISRLHAARSRSHALDAGTTCIARGSISGSELLAVDEPHPAGQALGRCGVLVRLGYLNEVLADAFSIKTANSVTVVDPSPTADLQADAPNIWTKLNRLSSAFEHVQASGADVLDELRTAYSKAWARKFYASGASMANNAGIAVTPSPDALAGADLYNLRRDVEGLPYNRAATLKQPPAEAAEAALMHFELISAGASTQGAWLSYSGRAIRIVNGAGQRLADVRERYLEPATMTQPDIVICAGAVDLGVPATLIASGRGASIMRPAHGGPAKWLTRQQAHTELGL
jgi:hypothetical protein